MFEIVVHVRDDRYGVQPFLRLFDRFDDAEHHPELRPLSYEQNRSEERCDTFSMFSIPFTSSLLFSSRPNRSFGKMPGCFSEASERGKKKKKNVV
jgi:hypothetical protein